jgi:hypothetical protein
MNLGMGLEPSLDTCSRERGKDHHPAPSAWSSSSGRAAGVTGVALATTSTAATAAETAPTATVHCRPSACHSRVGEVVGRSRSNAR